MEVVKELVIVMVLVEVIKEVLLVKRYFFHNRRVVDRSRRPVCGCRGVVLRLRLRLWLWWHGLLVEVVKDVVVVMVFVEVIVQGILVEQVPGRRVVDWCR